MFITKGGQYTFHFSLSGNDILGTMGQPDSLLANGIISGGFPVSISWHGVSQGSSSFLGGLKGGGTADIAFTYNGQDTDSDTLGNAMQDSVNSANVFGSLSSTVVNFESADEGDTTTGLFSEAARNLPSPTTVGVGVVVILLAVVAVFAFSEAIGARVG